MGLGGTVNLELKSLGGWWASVHSRIPLFPCSPWCSQADPWKSLSCMTVVNRVRDGRILLVILSMKGVHAVHDLQVVG